MTLKQLSNSKGDMEEALKQCIIQIDKRLTNIESAQVDISKKLDNHVTHIAADMTGVRTDIEWIKRFVSTGEKPLDKTESKNDIKTQTDVDWLKRFFFIGISAVITSLASLVMMLVHIFLGK
jgi:hypothetical protein